LASIVDAKRRASGFESGEKKKSKEKKRTKNKAREEKMEMKPK
jgi:hypothetical protein